MSKKVYIFLADGFEDIEGLTVVDLLRRAEIDIKTVSIKETKQIQTSHGITISVIIIIKLYCHFIFKEEHFSWKSNANF